jgi:hypothetical protein
MHVADRDRLLLVSDLAYQARGRRYGDEDVALAARLRESFDVALCHPLDAERLMPGFDAVMMRNSGPVDRYRAAYDAFRAAALRDGVPVFNELTGKADIHGKKYLVDLTGAGARVVPTADTAEGAAALPKAGEYIVKPRGGADSIGLRTVAYEVSFYFVDRDFQYAMYAPRPARRWELRRYDAGVDDLRFAQWFVDWNDIDHGIQRVDACRTGEGRLLLMELEDLNPYLSLELVDDGVRDAFTSRVTESLHALLAKSPVRTVR